MTGEKGREDVEKKEGGNLHKTGFSEVWHGSRNN